MDRIVSSREDQEVAIPNSDKPQLKSYNDFRAEVEKPYQERRKLLTGRALKETTPRKYHLRDDERVAMLAEASATGGVINPLRNRVGAYWGQVEALIQLGANEYHSLKAIRDKMQEIMCVIPKKKKIGGKVVETTLWSDFFDKRSRDGASKPKDGMGRVEQNFKVLQRLPRPGKREKNPYGLKLAQFGMCVDMEYREVAEGIWLPFVRLNTGWQPDTLGESINPIYSNPGSKRRKKTAPEGNTVESSESTVSTVVTEDKSVSSENLSPQEIAAPISSHHAEPDMSCVEEGKTVIGDTLNDFEAQQSQHEASKADRVA